MQRTPEPEIVMETPDSVAAFDAAGDPGGPLFPIYEVNATRLSNHLREGAVVVDLFCGSGRMLRRLLGGRSDLSVIGVDLSERMLATASAAAERDGVADRVRFVRADAATVDTVVTGPVDAVTSLSALHHCPSHDDLVAVLSAIARLRSRTGCGVWLFDLVRPEDESLVRKIPRAHEVSAGRRLAPAFKDDWMTSLAAGWTVDEFRDASTQAGLALTSVSADHSQLHWAPPVDAPAVTPDWVGPVPAADDARRAGTLAAALDL